MGERARPAAPSVVSVNISGGGIPKRPVEWAEVTPRGLAGDRHDHAKHRTPLQAVSVFDLEDLADLRADGYAVAPGSTGENLTVRGLDVDRLALGDRLVLSGGVTLELTKKRTPCFVLDAIDPAFKNAVVDRCGWYARVVRTGRVARGETIDVESAVPPRWPHMGAVLAGGRSTRMGAPKEHLVLPEGRPMIAAVASALWAVTPRVVVVGETAALPECPHLADRRPGQGPLGGIEALLGSDLDLEYLVCPCDLPRLRPEILRALAAAGPGRAAVVQVAGEPAPRPLPCRMAAEALAVVREQLDAGDRAVRRLMARLDPVTVEVPAEWGGSLVNVNTAADAASLGGRSAAEPKAG